MRHRYSPEQIEFLLAIVGVMLFASLWFPLMDRLDRGWGFWVEVPLAALPLVLLIAVLVVHWRRSRE